ncbi:uncharacterized protein IUM83_11013 [Phytophthora cinnamomi]|uniref:uncharacterized protein n=1 Tax=Phytophthora cinnamomi TaxID=4785 RepID=UPI003559C289|nr:hypothetical protein IUM83_11013 [Phytophthora cinnamomi]
MGTTMGTCGPGVAPTQECERHKALFLNLAEEAKMALTDLGATLKARLRDVEQQNEDLEEAKAELQEQNDELQKEKTRLGGKVQQLDASLREKREQLWETIEDFKDEVKEKKREVREAEDRQAEYRRVESVLREELVSLRREIHELKESFLQATTGFNEKELLASEAQARLRETVEQLERRLKTKDAEIGSLQLLIRDEKTSFSQANARLNEKASKATAKKARLKEKMAQLERRLEVQNKAFEEEPTS